MKKIFLILIILSLLSFPTLSLAEVKENTGAAGQMIPKLTEVETKDAPILMEGKVYPFWGPICMRYTYSVIYKDKQGREPEYVKIYFNGKMIDMDPTSPKASLGKEDFEKGVRYEFKNVPNKIGANFYYFEASNGAGKARDSIIDSPDNGPVLFASDFTKNEIVLIDKDKNEIKWRYPTDKEWIGGVALSSDGKYLAAQSSYHIYLFDTTKSEPQWIYDAQTSGEIGGDVKGGIAISASGEKIFAALGGKSILFDKKSNKPVWEYSGKGQVSGNAYNVAISDDGNFASSAMAGGGECETGQSQCQTKDVLILWDTKSKEPLWKYQTEGNFHDVSLSRDGSYLASSTGCPDRRAYIFSKDSSEPIVKSEMLTKDSPIDEAKISADGSLASFGAESSDGAVFLFSKDKKEPLWKFSTDNKSSVRALGFTPDGNYIGTATMAGNVYMFSKDSQNPISQWNVNASLGAADIADNSSYMAVGGTDKKVHIFQKDKTDQESEFEINEFVGEIDISANGQYIAAGTSGSVYFFESLDVDNPVAECAQIIEPEAEKNGADIDTSAKQTGLGLPLIISGSIFLFALIISAIYLILIKKKILAKNKTVAIILLALIIISLGWILLAPRSLGGVGFWQKPKDKVDDGDKSDQEQTENADNQKEDGASKTSPTGQAQCGNSMCEPDSGETKESCPKDCSGDNSNPDSGSSEKKVE